jgi:hypothetical protein
MRLRFDQLGKQIGRQALGPSGPTVAHDEISPDAQHADLRHEPDPAREAERARLGLLGRLASRVCLIEIYSDAPDEDEVLSCVGKLIAFRQKRARNFRRKRARGPAPADPFLWIIAARRPSGALAALGARESSDWPAGVYFGPDLLRSAIIVASELPRARETLLVRLMAAGPLLSRAIEDLSALPDDAHERVVAEQILLNLRHALGKKPSPTPEEQEFVMTMYKTWADARREGRDEGRAEEAARAVLTALRVRGITVPDAARERILAEKDPARLERWHERAILAASIAEVLDEPS